MFTAPQDVEFLALSLLQTVLSCRNAMDRFCVRARMDREDGLPLRVGCDWAMERGLVQHGSSNASARVWNRWSDESLYLTKAGRAWLKTRGVELKEIEDQVTIARIAFRECPISYGRLVVSPEAVARWEARHGKAA